MASFIQRHAHEITAVLSGFDRLRLQGTLRHVSHVGGMLSYLARRCILLKDFNDYFKWATARVRQGVEEFRTPDMGLSRSDRLVGLDGEPEAEVSAREDGVQFVKFRAEVGQSSRPMG